MRHEPSTSNNRPEVLAHAPEELTRSRLRRLGEGVGKVVYASEHWVVKRERSTSEIIALIALWKVIRRLEQFLPAGLGRRLLQHPSKQIRILRVMLQPIVLIVPRSVWFMLHIGEVWHVYTSRNTHGETLARKHLEGTDLVPCRIIFPPTRVKVGGWPGWLTVDEATERVDATLDQQLTALAAERRFDEVEDWLERFLALRQAGWRRGLFSVDAHMKNFGVVGDRVVLLDPGGLTTAWEDIERRLEYEASVADPHVRLGLAGILQARPDIAKRFDARWRAIVNLEMVQHHWPADPAA